ncbi:MAG: hypothetical protein ACLR1V_10625 [Coprococcus sp.]
MLWTYSGHGYGNRRLWYAGDLLSERELFPVNCAGHAKNDEELENYLPFTAVGSLDQQTFTNDDLGKTLTGTLTYIYGRSENLCSSDGELMEDDLTGCVLSSKAAWELFGESAITGGIADL